MKGLNLSGAAEQAGSDFLNERGIGIEGISPASKSKMTMRSQMDSGSEDPVGKSEAIM